MDESPGDFVEYEGELPLGRIQSIAPRMGIFLETDPNADFYTADQIRQLVLAAFPHEEGDPLHGLKSINIGNVSGYFPEEGLESMKKDGVPMGKIIEKLIPDLPVEGVEINLYVSESPSYVKKGTSDNFPYTTHITDFTATCLGYLMIIHDTVESNHP